MTFKECINTNGIVVDCDITGSRYGTYEVQFINSDTRDSDFVTFDIFSPGCNCGNDECERLFNDFCRTEGIHQNKVTEIHITRAS
jgi:hypothetical protein